MLSVLMIPLALGDNVVALLIALFGGAVASVAAGYFARPKTKGEAAQANAHATVSLSADARAWAELWMKKAEEAEHKADHAEQKAEEADERADRAERRAQKADARIDNLEAALTSAIVYTKSLQLEVNRLGGHVPPLPRALEDFETLLK